jgi:hypothetical protein
MRHLRHVTCFPFKTFFFRSSSFVSSFLYRTALYRWVSRLLVCTFHPTLTTVNIDHSIADISLAAFGRKEIEIAEVGLVSTLQPRLFVPKIPLIE